VIVFHVYVEIRILDAMNGPNRFAGVFFGVQGVVEAPYIAVISRMLYAVQPVHSYVV